MVNKTLERAKELADKVKNKAKEQSVKALLAVTLVSGAGYTADAKNNLPEGQKTEQSDKAALQAKIDSILTSAIDSAEAGYEQLKNDGVKLDKGETAYMVQSAISDGFNGRSFGNVAGNEKDGYGLEFRVSENTYNKLAADGAAAQKFFDMLTAGYKAGKDAAEAGKAARGNDGEKMVFAGMQKAVKSNFGKAGLKYRNKVDILKISRSGKEY